MRFLSHLRKPATVLSWCAPAPRYLTRQGINPNQLAKQLAVAPGPGSYSQLPRPHNDILACYLIRALQHIGGSGVCLFLSRAGRRAWTLPYTVMGERHLGGLGFALAQPNPRLLLMLIVRLMSRTDAFSHRRLLKRLFFLFAAHAPRLAVGLTLEVSGKISVGGNARSRMLRFRCGRYPHNQLRLKAAMYQQIVRTHTGCLGLRLGLWF